MIMLAQIEIVIERSDSDEAIQFFGAASGLLRFARNDEVRF
jgi:hypothetical protein